MNKMLITGYAIIAAFVVVAMPTKKELAKAQRLVEDVTSTDIKALKAGKKTMTEVAKSHMELAAKADNDAQRYLLLQGAFRLFARDGAYDDAAGALTTMCKNVKDVPPDLVVEIVNKEMRRVAGERAPKVLAIFNTAKRTVKCRNDLAALEKSLKEKPLDNNLNKRYGECLAELGDWNRALTAFSKADEPVRRMAVAETQGGKPLKSIADFWWDYMYGRSDESIKRFRIHAAKLYEKAIAEGTVTGLSKIQAERRIDETKEYGECFFIVGDTETKKVTERVAEKTPEKIAEKKTENKAEKDAKDENVKDLYCIIDLSAGATATSYPITYMDKPPYGGFNVDEYKTNKLVLRLIKPGKFKMSGEFEVTLTKPFYCGIFEVTQKQYELVMGINPSVFKGDVRPVETLSWNMIRGDSSVYNWPEIDKVDASTFIGRLQSRTGLNFDLPTEVQWEYACRAGTTSRFNNGGDTLEDLKKIGRCISNVRDGKGSRGKGKYTQHTSVGSYQPNAWGLYDMHGNVWEWCLNHEMYLVDGMTDPVGSTPQGSGRRAHRGGCWYDDVEKCSVLMRSFPPAVYVNDGGGFGFRIARTVTDQGKIQTERGVEETKESVAGISVAAKDGEGLYCVIDLSAGANATSYPVTYMDKPPHGGFNVDEYKTNKLVLRMINPGKFKMGGKYNVTLTKPFYCGIFEVTQKQYELVMGFNPSEFKGDMRPVERLNWNAIRGNSDTYNWPSSAKVDDSTFIGRIQKRTGLNFDLPTEAQWEYACCAGTTSKYNNGGDSGDDLKNLGRFRGNRYDGVGDDDKHVKVGKYLSNAWGLYDMHGNVWEWCLDWEGNLADGVVDPIGPSSGPGRVRRGGCWDSGLRGCASSARAESSPSLDDSHLNLTGFRLFRTMPNN